MNCRQAREHLLDALQDPAARAGIAGLDDHLRACAGCAAELESLRATMALMDDWQAPEPSPYFDSRLRARKRALESERVGWLAWLRKPALALALAALIAIGVSLFRSAPHVNNPAANGQKAVPAVVAEEQSAVEDLQELEQDDELYANFDLLDELEAEQEVNR
jgi:hypothetical protein